MHCLALRHCPCSNTANGDPQHDWDGGVSVSPHVHVAEGKLPWLLFRSLAKCRTPCENDWLSNSEQASTVAGGSSNTMPWYFGLEKMSNQAEFGDLQDHLQPPVSLLAKLCAQQVLVG